MKTVDLNDNRISVEFERREPLVLLKNLPVDDGRIFTFVALSVQQAETLRDQLDEALRMA